MSALSTVIGPLQNQQSDLVLSFEFQFQYSSFNPNFLPCCSTRSILQLLFQPKFHYLSRIQIWSFQRWLINHHSNHFTFIQIQIFWIGSEFFFQSFNFLMISTTNSHLFYTLAIFNSLNSHFLWIFLKFDRTLSSHNNG